MASFNNGYSLYDLLTPDQLELSQQMVRYWGAFVATGHPDVVGQPAWPRYSTSQLMSLRPGDQTQTISAAPSARNTSAPSGTRGSHRDEMLKFPECRARQRPTFRCAGRRPT
jgi:hypothetical protein